MRIVDLFGGEEIVHIFAISFGPVRGEGITVVTGADRAVRTLLRHHRRSGRNPGWLSALVRLTSGDPVAVTLTAEVREVFARYAGNTALASRLEDVLLGRDGLEHALGYRAS